MPHFHAKYVAEGLLEKSGVPWVSLRTACFLDQSLEVNADNAKAGRFVVGHWVMLSDGDSNRSDLL